MKAIVVGMGVQGKKRKKFLNKDFVCSVDKNKKADYNSIKKVPLKSYDTVFLCVPDDEKINLIKFCIKNKKHVLIEKPLLAKSNKELNDLEIKAKRKKLIIYTAYNHRFEPGILKIRNLIQSKKLGKIYRCKIFYGNGTSYVVKKNAWRDKKLGVITDLGSHLLNLCIFWFGTKIKKFKLISVERFENKSPDHAVILLEINKIKIELEVTLCMWKNTFSCDLIGSKGSAHLNSLCKWSNSSFIFRRRKFPSGKPNEKVINFKKGDPTWKLENMFFKNLIKKKTNYNLKEDIILNEKFNKIFLTSNYD